MEYAVDAELSPEATKYHLHHVVLPPELPQSDDYDAEHDRSLLQTATSNLQKLKPFVEAGQVGVVDAATASFQNLNHCLNNDGTISQVSLNDLLARITKNNSTGVIPLPIKAQNAGLVIRKEGDHIVFEAFELSPTNEAVIQTKGRLIRQFPGLAVRVTKTKMMDENLRNTLAATLAKMSAQAAPNCLPQTRKAGQIHDETRNTMDPKMVTDYLMNVIANLGEVYEVLHIRKETREEVLWDSCELPWRRSPMWLLLRVTLQLHFNRECQSLRNPKALYKGFMIFVLCDVLSMVGYRRRATTIIPTRNNACTMSILEANQFHVHR